MTTKKGDHRREDIGRAPTTGEERTTSPVIACLDCGSKLTLRDQDLGFEKCFWCDAPWDPK